MSEGKKELIFDAKLVDHGNVFSINVPSGNVKDSGMTREQFKKSFGNRDLRVEVKVLPKDWKEKALKKL